MSGPATTAVGPNTLMVPAPAKVNLFLRVLGRRDDRYHDLDTVIVPIDLVDSVEVHAASDAEQFRTLSLSLEVSGEPALTRGVPVDESNLVLRAARALAERIDARGFADISLEKRIPSAAGLGGGSSDAAAVLQALKALWGTGLRSEELRQVAAEVGSDVPALLEGGPVRARGRGESVESADVTPLRWVLVNFSFGVDTADAYAWWDTDPGTTGPDPEPLLAAARAGESDPSRLADLLYNDLEVHVARRHPVIREAKEALREAGAVASIMCGSGPTVAGVLPSGRERLEASAEAELLRISGTFPVYASSWSGPLGAGTPLAGPPRFERGFPGPKPGVLPVGRRPSAAAATIPFGSGR